MKPADAVAGILSVLTLIAALVWPQIAGSLLRGLCVALAVAFVARRAYASELPFRLGTDVYSPFESTTSRPDPARTLARVGVLSGLLKVADDPIEAQRVPIPSTARRIVVAHVSRRLAQQHGLSLDEPMHRDRIRSLLADTTWLLVRQGSAEIPRIPHADDVSLDRLTTILDDVEPL